MIIAGYEKALRDCFFAYNEGLKRRFPFRYHIDDYKPAELREIFLYQVDRDSWAIDDKAAPLSLFEEHKDYFKYNGGCTENLLMKSKLAHARRIFGGFTFGRKVLTSTDVKAGLDIHKDHYGEIDDGWKNVAHMYM